jgi:CheY-like chemotaxis protein
MDDTRNEFRRSVLIVDVSDDSRDVLKAVLELRGWEIIEAQDAADGLEKAERLQPNVILLDTDAPQANEAEMQARYSDASRRNNARLVVLGRARISARSDQSRHLAKPYHYAPLIRTIDELAASVRANLS